MADVEGSFTKKAKANAEWTSYTNRKNGLTAHFYGFGDYCLASVVPLEVIP